MAGSNDTCRSTCEIGAAGTCCCMWGLATLTDTWVPLSPANGPTLAACVSRMTSALYNAS